MESIVDVSIFWEQVELNILTGMSENAAIQAACEQFNIEFGEL